MSQYKGSLHRYKKLPERMNCMSDSEEFQDLGSNYSGNFPRVPSQPAVVPSPRSMLSRDRSMPFDEWNLTEAQGNFFGNPRSMFDSSQTPQGIVLSTNPSATSSIPMQASTGRLVARREERIERTTPVPISARRPSTINSFLPAEVPKNSMAEQERLQISELQFGKFIPHTIIIDFPRISKCWTRELLLL